MSLRSMSPMTKALLFALTLLIIDAAIELAFISTTVSWLHHRASGYFLVDRERAGLEFVRLHGEPLHLIVDQGHTSNGAAGTALVLVGFGGLVALWLRSKNIRFVHHVWLIITFASTILTLVALTWTFVVTSRHEDQTIDVASRAAAVVTNAIVVEREHAWTPENWMAALLSLPLYSTSDRRDIASHFYIARGWRWNLIPLFLLGIVVCATAVTEAIEERKKGHRRTRVADKVENEYES